MKTLSVVIPVYNERGTIRELLNAVEKIHLSALKKEVIVVDDCSADGTRDILRSLGDDPRYRIFFHDRNKGKGAALRLGFSKVTGDFVIIQDADLEYDPGDYPIVLGPLLSGKADVVYGSRFMGAAPRRVLFFWHYLANRLVTTLSNLFTDLNLSDMETCYKAFTREVLVTILPHLRSNRFGIEPELTARFAKHRFRIYEVGISYAGRTYEEGKKISWKDGLAAIWFIIKYNLFR